MKGIYLASYKALHPSCKNLVYQDINGFRDIDGDMLDVNLDDYDYIIATPPCNYYSRANYRRDVSSYSLNTKHLLPCILDKLIKLGKPFIVENVRSSVIFKKAGLFDLPCLIYFIGRHTYWTNVMFVHDMNQNIDYVAHAPYVGNQLHENTYSSNREGGKNVHEVIEMFLQTIGAD